MWDKESLSRKKAPLCKGGAFLWGLQIKREWLPYWGFPNLLFHRHQYR